MNATHVLEGRELRQRTDKLERVFYVDAVTGARVATAGKTPTLLLTGGDGPSIAEIVEEMARQVANGEREEFADPFADLPEDDDPTVADSANAPMPEKSVPTDLSLDDFAVALEARGRMYSERGRTAATYIGDDTVNLSLPNEEGGHDRYILHFPERINVELARA